MRILLCFLMLMSTHAWAWGRRGHQMVGETAALLASEEPQGAFLRDHSFDMGFYANVPDFIWKRPKTNKIETPHHFMDLEIFERAIKDGLKDALKLSRKDFEKKYPEVKPDAGRAYWRVRELFDKIGNYTQQLKSAKGKDRRSLQEKWLVTAGVMGHYIGDLAQPLHVTENYNGQHTGQKGIHRYFEDEVVDWVYPEMAVKVYAKARARWPEFKKANGSKSVLELLESLTESSRREVKTVLSLDKAAPRAAEKNAKRFEALIEARLVEGALTLAELHRRNLGWEFDGHKFYFFAGEPEYIYPEK